MKLLHTADWHLGNTFHGYERSAEHAHFLDWLLSQLLEQAPDALLIAGDIFDNANPSAAAEKMFYNFLDKAVRFLPGLQIVITAGNHDSGGRLEAPSAFFRTRNIYTIGTLQRDADGIPDFARHLLPLSLRGEEEARIVVFALPFLRPMDFPSGTRTEDALKESFDHMHKALKQSAFKNLPIVVCAHFYAAGAQINVEEHSERLVVGGQEVAEVKVIGKNIAYAALGHIHKTQRLDDNAYYAGAPVPMSFSEKHYKQGINCITIDEDGFTLVTRLDYAPLRKLISVPSGGVASAKEMLALLAGLPDKTKRDEGAEWAYLEIRVQENRPEPSLLHEVEQILTQKAVRFCRMVRETSANTQQNEAIKLQTLDSLNPRELIKAFYKSRFNEDLPASLLSRLDKVVEEVMNERN